MPDPSLCECGCGKPTKFATKTDSRRGVVKGQPMRMLKGHWLNIYNREKPRQPDYEVDAESGCWLWLKSLNGDGYGRVRVGEGLRSAHRVYYERQVGPIPQGLELDHLCRNRACVNPEHLEPVTKRENILRGEGMGARYARRTHCPQGHALAGDNLYVAPNGARRCRACRRVAGW